MWRAYEIVGLLLVGVLVAGIRIAQLFDPAFNATWFLLPHPPWRWVHRPPEVYPWLPHLTQLATGAALLLGAVAVFWTLFRLYRRQVQSGQMRSVRILLSRDDTAQPLTVGALMDAWAQTAENRYLARLMGNDPVALDIVRAADGRLLLYLRSTGRTVDALTSRLRATWTNIRTCPEAVPEVDGPIAVSVTPRVRNTLTRGFRTYRDYAHSITESLLAVLDEASGPAHVQIVLSPRSARFNARAERVQRSFEQEAKARGVDDPSAAGMGIGETAQLQAVVKTAGRQWWRTEIRMVTQHIPTLQALVGALNEAAAENSWVYHRVWLAPVRRRFDAWRRYGMPGVWPLLGATSLPGVFLATLWQIPSARLRVSGLLREQTRRGPALLSIPTVDSAAGRCAGVTPVRDESGRTILIPAADLRWNALATGSHGAGKSTVLQQFWRFAANNASWAGVLIDPKGALADSARAMVPPGRPCVTWRVGHPNAAWGYNPFLGATEWDLTVDRLLSVMKQAWTDGSIMARSEDILRHVLAAIFDLGQQTEAFIAARRLLEEPGAWSQVAGRLRDPDLRSWFTRWAADYREDPKSIISALAAPLNKLSGLTFGARRAAATSSPTSLHLERILRDRGLLIVNLASDEVGEDNAALVGILLLAGLWNALRGAAAAEGGEVPTMIVLDETHRFLGETFFRLIAEGRSSGAATAMGLQFVGQLQDERAQATVRELVQHRFVFRSQNVEEAAAEAQLMARIYANMISPDQELQDTLAFTPDDIFNLPNYRAITRVLVGGKPQTAFLGQTIPVDLSGKSVPWGTCPEGWLYRAPSPSPSPSLSRESLHVAAAAEEDGPVELALLPPISREIAPTAPEVPPVAAETDGEAATPLSRPSDAETADPSPAPVAVDPPPTPAAGPGIPAADVARIEKLFGKPATDAALAELRRQPPGSVRSPAGFVYKVAERRHQKEAAAR